jgi:hypothetical protein
MSNIVHFVRRLWAALTLPNEPVDPETMPLRDWADLPRHHPRCDNAPC